MSFYAKKRRKPHNKGQFLQLNEFGFAEGGRRSTISRTVKTLPSREEALRPAVGNLAK